MSVLTPILLIVVVGVLLWAVDKFAPMTPATKTLLKVFAIGVLVVWLLSVIGVFDALRSVPVPRVR